jgi:hypothetical protein
VAERNAGGYALLRARISARVLLDLVDNDQNVSIEPPPSIELEGMELLDIDNPGLPGSLERVAVGPPGGRHRRRGHPRAASDPAGTRRPGASFRALRR